MEKYYDATLRQVEDWHSNMNLRKRHVPSIMEFETELEDIQVDEFCEAYASVISKHESLRTTFVKINGVIRQRVIEYESDAFGLQCIGLPWSAQLVRNLSRSAALSVKDLRHGPLIKGILIKIDDKRHFFKVVIHHIISDFWSLKIFQEDLHRSYMSLRFGLGTIVSEPQPQLGAFAEAKFENLARYNRDSVAYWQDRLQSKKWQIDYDKVQRRAANPEALQINGHSAASGYHWKRFTDRHFQKFPFGKIYTVYVDPSVYHAMAGFRKKNGLTTFGILLGCFNILCSVFLGFDDVLIQSLYYYRNDPVAKGIIGNFLCHVMLYTEVDRSVILSDFLVQCQQALIQAIEQHLLFNRESILKLGIRTKSFIFINFISREISGFGDCAIEAGRFEPFRHSWAPLYCFAREYANTIELRFEFHTSFYSETAIKRMADFCLDVLATIVSAPDVRLDEAVCAAQSR